MSVANPVERSLYHRYRFPRSSLTPCGCTFVSTSASVTSRIVSWLTMMPRSVSRSWRDQTSAERYLLRVLQAELGAEPRVVITDKLASYPPATRRMLPNTEHRRHKRLNNRAEIRTCRPRKRERVLQRFKSAEHAQCFLGPFSAVSNHFRLRRHLFTAPNYRKTRYERYAVWLDVTLGGVRQ